MQVKKIYILLFVFMFALTACNSTTAQDQIYEHLEEAVKLEKAFEEQQNSITELEGQEQEIYNQITELSIDDMDSIQELANKAIEIIETRLEKINIEKESIHSSKTEFEKIAPLIDELKEEEAKEKAGEMYNVMMSRYEAYDYLYDAYVKSLEEEEHLYELLKDKDVSEDDLKDQIAKINNTYEEVINSNRQFNENTVLYNELKKEFYEVANIHVIFEAD